MMKGTIDKPKRNMVVSLIGRPNVGKSSLFNALMGKQHKSITFDEPGVTRDRHYGITTLEACGDLEAEDVILVDTGGFYPQKVDETEENKNKFFNIMTTHAETAIAESDLVLMVVDVREGVLPFDLQIARVIKQQGKGFWLLINKYDTEKQAGDEADFYEIPGEEFFLLSAAHSRGLSDLKERLHREAYGFSLGKQGGVNLSQGITPREDVVARLSIIGAPNAGKSTLLNQLLGSERALVSDIPGTTVDPIEGYFDLFFGEKVRELSALKGVDFKKNDKILFQQYEDFRHNNPDFFTKVLEAYQTEEILTEHDGEIFEEDAEEAESFLYDDEDGENLNAEFENRSLSEVDETYQTLFEEGEEERGLSAVEEEEETNFWRSLHVIDTAGIRKKANIKDFVEGQSVYRSLRCISESDIVIFMIDATKGIGHQDRRLMDIALEKGKSLIVCLNKMDLLKGQLKTDKERKEWLEDLRYKVPWLHFCDLLPLSAKRNTGLKRLKKMMVKTILVRHRVVPTSELNRTVFSMVEKNPVIVNRSGGKRLKVKYASQVKSGPPTFLFFTNRSKGIPENYKRYLRNGLRRDFHLDNTPVHLIFRTGTDLEKRMKKIRS